MKKLLLKLLLVRSSVLHEFTQQEKFHLLQGKTSGCLRNSLFHLLLLLLFWCVLYPQNNSNFILSRQYPTISLWFTKMSNENGKWSVSWFLWMLHFNLLCIIKLSWKYNTPIDRCSFFTNSCLYSWRCGIEMEKSRKSHRCKSWFCPNARYGLPLHYHGHVRHTNRNRWVIPNLRIIFYTNSLNHPLCKALQIVHDFQSTWLLQQECIVASWVASFSIDWKAITGNNFIFPARAWSSWAGFPSFWMALEFLEWCEPFLSVQTGLLHTSESPNFIIPCPKSRTQRHLTFGLECVLPLFSSLQS